MTTIKAKSGMRDLCATLVRDAAFRDPPALSRRIVVTVPNDCATLAHSYPRTGASGAALRARDTNALVRALRSSNIA